MHDMIRKNQEPIARDRRKIDLLHPRNAKCVLLAMLGFSYKHITKQTRLTTYEITYRMKLAKVKLNDYRSGKSASAQTVQRAALDQFGQFLAKQLSEPGKRKVICVDGNLLIK
jgi:hypothetical protein